MYLNVQKTTYFMNQSWDMIPRSLLHKKFCWLFWVLKYFSQFLTGKHILFYFHKTSFMFITQCFLEHSVLNLTLNFRVKFSRLEYSPAMKSANELDAPISSKHFFASNSVLSKQNVHFLCWNQLNVSKYTRLS